MRNNVFSSIYAVFVNCRCVGEILNVDVLIILELC